MSSQEADKVHDPAQSLAPLTANLLKPGRYSDLNIKCRGKVFKAHRNVVAFQSKPLAAAIDGDFEVSSGSLAALVHYCFHSRMIANIFSGSKDMMIWKTMIRTSLTNLSISSTPSNTTMVDRKL
jgi:hypothetical protein